MNCVFLGHANGEFGYRLWDLVNNKVIRNKVIFNELEMFQKFAHNMEVKKVVGKSIEQHIDIPSLQENEHHIQEKYEQQMEYDKKHQEETIQ
jgi:hypothetical protein